MEGYEPGTYGRSFADVYDDWYPAPSDTAATVARLVELAGAGPVLELGVGTGRLALPVADAGVEVVGVDASPEMLALLAAKPGADRVRAILADMAELPVSGVGRFTLAWAAINTFFNLGTAAAQLACLRRVAALLCPGGRFVIEAFVPPDPADIPTASVAPSTLSTDRLVLTATRHDPGTQTISGHHVELVEGETVRLRPWLVRYATPDQLDEMAAAAGLTRESRHEGWLDEPFTDASGHHVTVYRAPR